MGWRKRDGKFSNCLANKGRGEAQVTREGFKGVAATLGGPELVLGGGGTGGRRIHVWWGILPEYGQGHRVERRGIYVPESGISFPGEVEEVVLEERAGG